MRNGSFASSVVRTALYENAGDAVLLARIHHLLVKGT